MGLGDGRPKTGLIDNPVLRPSLASQGIDENLAHQARMLGFANPTSSATMKRGAHQLSERTPLIATAKGG
jgi:hypothetical protein